MIQLPLIASDEYEQRKRALDVLLHLIKQLSSFQEESVLIGGWIPFFAAERHIARRLPHPGSFDVDLLFDPSALRGRTDELHDNLGQCGFYHSYSGPRFTYYHDIRREGMEPLIIKSDLVCGDHYVEGRPVRYKKIKGLTLRTARAGAMSLIAPLRVNVDWCGQNVAFRMADPVTFLVLKGMVMAERERMKDAFDVFHLIAHSRFRGDALLESVKIASAHPVIMEGLTKLRVGFQRPDSPGPYGAARFLGIEDRDQAERFRINVHAVVSGFLETAGIEVQLFDLDTPDPLVFDPPPPIPSYPPLNLDYLDLVDDLFCGACHTEPMSVEFSGQTGAIYP